MWLKRKEKKKKKTNAHIDKFKSRQEETQHSAGEVDGYVRVWVWRDAADWTLPLPNGDARTPLQSGTQEFNTSD